MVHRSKDLNSDHRQYLGLDIGGSKCAVVIGSADGTIIDRIQWPSDAARGPQPMLDELLGHSRTMIAKHAPVAIGVSIGGPLDAQAGIIHSPPNLPGWDNIPLKQLLSSKLNLPTRIEHDAAACAFAEFHWGAGRGSTRLIYLTCGTGFGAGMIFDGQVYRGAHGRSVEIGHARYRDEGPTAFGKSGSFESFCAASALGKLAAWRFPARWPSTPLPQQIAELARSGDADAAEVIKINARAVGDACAVLGDLLRPDLFLLGSLARYLGDEWIDAVRAQFVAQTLPDTATSCRIEAAQLGDRLQDCSALVVAVYADAK